MSRLNPFHEPPLHKAFYHPSRLKDVGKIKKNEGVLSSDRQTEDEEREKDKLSHADLLFLRSGVHLKDKWLLPTENGSPRDNSEQFDESWPVTERPSSLSFPGVSPASASVRQEMDDLDPVKSQLDFRDEENKDSTLSKYIERFRKGPPMSRGERDQLLEMSRKKDFWWMNDSQSGPNDSSTPKSERSKGQGRSRSPPGSPTESRIGSAMNSKHQGHRSKGSNGRSPSPISRNLADKADRLLEKIESSYLTSDIDGAVSTVGLGSSPSDSTFEAKETPYRPAFTRTIQSDGGRKLFPDKLFRAEDDILHQWRMRRKLELAREKASKDPYSSGNPKAYGNDSLSAFRARLAQQNDNNAQLGQVVSLKRGKGNDGEKENVRPPATNVIENSAEPRKEIETQTEMPVTDQLSPEESKDVPVIIASPQLGRKIQTDKYPVLPHVHLSCDIIPCHQGNHHDNKANSHHRGYGCRGHMCSCHGDKREKDSTKSLPKKFCPAETELDETDLDEKPTKESTDFEADSDYEKCKRDHLMALHREIEESLNSDAYSVRSHDSDRRSGKSRESKTERKTGKSSQIDDVPNVPEKESVTDKRLDDISKKDKSSSRKWQDVTKPGSDCHSQIESKSIDVKRRSDKGKLSKQKHLRDLSDDEQLSSINVQSSAEFDLDLMEKNGGKGSKSNERNAKNKHNHEQRVTKDSESSIEDSKEDLKTPLQKAEMSASRMEGNNKRRKPEKFSKTPHPAPTRSDSHPQASVGSAIGQVVNERLFLGASVSSIEEQGAAPPRRSQSVQPPTLEDLETLVSDDETFAEDEMLQELRKKRKHFLDKLKEVELLLSAPS